MRNPRIYIVIGTFHPLLGGAEMQAMTQGHILRARGYAATILTLRHQKAWLPHEIITGVPVLRVAGTLLNKREKQAHVLRQVRYLLALVVLGWTLWQKRQSYDILHVYQFSLLTLPVALACYFTKKPLIVSVRSTGSGKTRTTRGSVPLLAGGLDPSTPCLQVDGLTWIDGDLESLVRLGKPVIRFVRALLSRLQARIIILSSRMQGYLAAHDFLLPDLQLIPNGVDITRYHPEEIVQPDQAYTVICVSKLRYEKGIDVLLHAWYLVQQQCPQARLLLVGSGPIQKQLTGMVEALDIQQSVEFMGVQSDIPAQLRRAGVAVLPSRWEGMPNALLEAMASGLPCVATRVSGSEDIIQHEVNGLLVNVEDYQDMARALLTLLHNPELAQTYARVARTTIENHYSLECITDSYIELYHKLAILNK